MSLAVTFIAKELRIKLKKYCMDWCMNLSNFVISNCEVPFLLCLTLEQST